MVALARRHERDLMTLLKMLVLNFIAGAGPGLHMHMIRGRSALIAACTVEVVAISAFTLS